MLHQPVGGAAVTGGASGGGAGVFCIRGGRRQRSRSGGAGAGTGAAVLEQANSGYGAGGSSGRSRLWSEVRLDQE